MATRDSRSEPAPTAPLSRPAGRAWRLLPVLALLACVCAAQPAGQVLEVVPLRHRDFTEIRPLLEPLLAPGATLTGNGGQLILRTTPDNLAELKQALAALDTRQQRLRISVTQTRIEDSAFDSYGVDARVRAGDATVEIGAPPGGPGSALDARITRTHGQDEGTNLYTVLALDGQTAFVDTGEAQPQPYVSQQWGPYGGIVQGGVDYVETRSGLHVTPRLRGDGVTLEVASQREDFAPDGTGGITTSGVDTVVSGRLGEWLPLGGVATTTAGDQSGLLAHTRRRDNAHAGYWIRVDLVP
jgi:hypothetical protein